MHGCKFQRFVSKSKISFLHSFVHGLGQKLVLHSTSGIPDLVGCHFDCCQSDSYVLLKSRKAASKKTSIVIAGDAGSLINLTWSLNETASGLIAIGTGYLQAANEDDVQPLAILAAERFGATLAMAQESCRKTEREAFRNHRTMIVKFLKAAIGYSSSDTAARLAKTSSGVRFLALASTLICLSIMQHGGESARLDDYFQCRERSAVAVDWPIGGPPEGA